jgi:hypothetical protein
MMQNLVKKKWKESTIYEFIFGVVLCRAVARKKTVVGHERCVFKPILNLAYFYQNQSKIRGKSKAPMMRLV